MELCGAAAIESEHMGTRLLAGTLLWGALMSGCAPYRVYQKCGFAGCPGDRDLARSVRARLDQHTALLAPNLVYVKALDHVVYLSGWVDTDLQRKLAQDLAMETDGVTRVVNSLGLSDNR